MAGGFFRLIFYLLIAYLVYLVLRLIIGPARRFRPLRPPRRLSGTMVKDEICNTYLPREDAIIERVDGTDHFFCSKECRDQFMKRKKGKEPAAV
jgi:YHS domain-containing protein